jgi:hypothetical protein
MGDGKGMGDREGGAPAEARVRYSRLNKTPCTLFIHLHVFVLHTPLLASSYALVMSSSHLLLMSHSAHTSSHTSSLLPPSSSCLLCSLTLPPFSGYSAGCLRSHERYVKGFLGTLFLGRACVGGGLGRKQE